MRHLRVVRSQGLLVDLDGTPIQIFRSRQISFALQHLCQLVHHRGGRRAFLSRQPRVEDEALPQRVLRLGQVSLHFLQLPQILERRRDGNVIQPEQALVHPQRLLVILFGHLDVAIGEFELAQCAEARRRRCVIPFEQVASGGQGGLELRTRLGGGPDAQVGAADRFPQRGLLFRLVVQARDALRSALEDLTCSHLFSA